MPDEVNRLRAPSIDLTDGDGRGLDRNLGRLVVGLIDAVRLILERQAVRRVEGDGLSPAEAERLGNALIAIEGKMSELKHVFRMEPEDMNIPIGNLEGREVTLVDAVDALISKGVVLDGRLAITLADVELLRLGLQIVLASPDTLDQ